jgi:hypothetical protein
MLDHRGNRGGFHNRGWNRRGAQLSRRADSGAVGRDTGFQLVTLAMNRRETGVNIGYIRE